MRDIISEVLAQDEMYDDINDVHLEKNDVDEAAYAKAYEAFEQMVARELGIWFIFLFFKSGLSGGAAFLYIIYEGP